MHMPHARTPVRRYFLQSLLLSQHVSVFPIGFHRTDVRRVGSIARDTARGSRLAADFARQDGTAGYNHTSSAWTAPDGPGVTLQLERVCVPDLYWNCRRGAHKHGLQRCHDWNELPADDEQRRLAAPPAPGVETKHAGRQAAKRAPLACTVMCRMVGVLCGCAAHGW